MGVPKKRRSYTRRHKRRTHHALKTVTLATCTNCGEPVMPHRICPHCNFYRGKRVALSED